MATFFRKAIKVGPFRLNLSKGGVGVSGGITGLRLGMDARGKSYVHAGRHGVYHKEYLGQPKQGTEKRSSRNHQNQEITENAETPGSRAGEQAKVTPENLSRLIIRDGYPKNDTPYWTLTLIPLFFIGGLFSELFLVLFLLSLPVIPVTIFVFSYKSKARRKEFRKYLSKMEELLQSGQFAEAKEAIQSLPSLPNFRKEEFSEYLFGSIHVMLLSVLARDLNISDDEAELMKSVSDQLPEAHLLDINQFFLYEYTRSFLGDYDLNSEQLTFLKMMLKQIPLKDEDKNYLENITGLFDQIHKIRQGNINPEVKNIGPGQENVYFEQRFRTLNPASRTVREEGTLYATDKGLSIAASGHREVSYMSILSIEPILEEDSLSITVHKRKTPLIIQTDNSLILYEIIKYFKRQQ